MNILKKLNRSFKEQGIKKTLILMVNNAVRIPIDYLFDLKYGVDTGGIVSSDKLDISDSEKSNANQYEPTPASAARALFKKLDIDHSRYTLIDYGSGKGRILLLASEYPYKGIIGVEFSQRLHEIAEKNIKIWKNPKQKCRNIRSICLDARDYKLPQTALVLFFFTPFEPGVAKRVVDNIREDYAKNPRPFLIVYYGTNQDFIQVLSTLNFSCTEVYSHRPLSAQKPYKGYVFKSNAISSSAKVI